MKERGIIFNTEMVQAILDWRKTQTRRVIKPKPPDKTENGTLYTGFQKTTLPASEGYDLTSYLDNPKYIGKCPYGQIGDRLYVRETWSACPVYEIDNGIFEAGYPYTNIPKDKPSNACIIYAADDPGNTDEKWRPSIHMPKWAARIWLEITDIRVERVRDISRKDAIAEGSYLDACDCFKIPPKVLGSYLEITNCEKHGPSFKRLWNSINEKRGFGWDSNPWVWVIEFRRIKK